MSIAQPFAHQIHTNHKHKHKPQTQTTEVEAEAVSNIDVSLCIILRILVGAAMALIYPPSVKIISSWFKYNRGFAVGVVIGALTLGTALEPLHLVQHLSLVYCCRIRTKSYQITTDYVMQPWTTVPNSLPFSDGYICVGFDYDINTDIITFVGGYNDGKRVCQYNISSNTAQCGQQDLYNILCRPSTFLSVNKNMYLLNYDTFLVFDMAQNSLGDTLTQPTVYVISRCMATDGENIYLIGGWDGNYINSFKIFDIRNNKWQTGPVLNEKRSDSACVYNQNNNIIYIFGGEGENGGTNILQLLRKFVIRNMLLQQRHYQWVLDFL